MTEDELRVVQKCYTKLKKKTEGEESLQQSHSIEEAEEMYDLQKGIEKGVKKKVEEAKAAKKE